MVVGAGPAGLSAALHLLAEDASWSERMVVLEKAIHPRRKLCAGGITAPGLEILARLGIDLGTAAAPVDRLRIEYGGGRTEISARPPLKVVCREAFDAAVCRQAIERGVRVRQGEPITDVSVHEGRVEVSTRDSRWSARAVVAADGSNSRVRRCLEREGRLPRRKRRSQSRLLEVRRPARGHESEFANREAVFDFSAARGMGLQGYAWSFPSWVGGRPVLNSGVFDSRARDERPPARLRTVLQSFLAARDERLERLHLGGFPLQPFDPEAALSTPGVLLAGDAAGADPLLGEGISFALGYGEVAAAALSSARSADDYAFGGYRRAVLEHELLGSLPARAAWAHRIYRLGRPWQQSVAWGALRLFLSLKRPRLPKAPAVANAE